MLTIGSLVSTLIDDSRMLTGMDMELTPVSTVLFLVDYIN